MSNTNISDIKKVQKLDRSKPPKSGKPKDISFPKFYETKTANGITVLVIEDRRLPLVTSRFVFKSGAYMDHFAGKNKAGLVSMTSELITKGTSKRSATEIAEEVDYIGANLSSGSDYDATYVSTYSLKKYFDNIFDIVADVILDPSFDETELKRVREQRLNSLLSMTDDGEYLADRAFKKFVYKNTPYEMPAEGTRVSVENITRDDIVSVYKKIFVPENLIVAFVGDISPDEAMEKMNTAFPAANNHPAPSPEILVPEDAREELVALTEKPGAVQSSIRAGHKGISRDNPDFIAVHVMNTMLGGYFTSRINKNLREVNGYTYGARSYFSSNRFAGDFSVVTEVKNEITADTIKEIIKELNDIRENYVSAEELQNVKNYISGSFPLQLETPNAIASKVISLKLYNLGDDYYNTYIRKVNELTKDDIREAARKYIHPDKLTISISGNVNEIEESMKQFGKTEVIQEVN